MRLLLFCTVFFCQYLPAKSITITTAPWQPYIQTDHNGSAAELLRQVYSQNDTEINWLIQNYDLAFQQVAEGKKLASFPYFKTSERAKLVHYSEPVFSVTSYLYFNRQFNQKINKGKLSSFTVGKVAGYSYGEGIDRLVLNAKVFGSEVAALKALFIGKIDYLPMTESVMNYLLNTQFNEQKLLIKTLDNIKDTASLHLIAAKNKQGASAIETLNLLLKKVVNLQSFKLTAEVLKIAPDIAKLTISEGYPVILAQNSLSEKTQYYTLAQGTKVLVIEWSEKLLNPSKTDRIYKNMMGLSKVVILNGPLVGKEAYVRNMHIELN